MPSRLVRFAGCLVLFGVWVVSPLLVSAQDTSISYYPRREGGGVFFSLCPKDSERVRWRECEQRDGECEYNVSHNLPVTGQ